jgi:hypothetical protein
MLHMFRECVYNAELMRVLTNWLAHGHMFTITGQWHLETDLNKDEDCKIVIGKLGMTTIVLKLLATGDAAFIMAHVKKTLDHKVLFSADEAWVVHFTCKDNYFDHPVWQSRSNWMKAASI